MDGGPETRQPFGIVRHNKYGQINLAFSCGDAYQFEIINAPLLHKTKMRQLISINYICSL